MPMLPPPVSLWTRQPKARRCGHYHDGLVEQSSARRGVSIARLSSVTHIYAGEDGGERNEGQSIAVMSRQMKRDGQEIICIHAASYCKSCVGGLGSSCPAPRPLDVTHGIHSLGCALIRADAALTWMFGFGLGQGLSRSFHRRVEVCIAMSFGVGAAVSSLAAAAAAAL